MAGLYWKDDSPHFLKFNNGWVLKGIIKIVNPIITGRIGKSGTG
jgi:hypothetical protein